MVTQAADAGTSGSPNQNTASDWVTYQAKVTAVRLGADPNSLLLTVDLLAGPGECSRNPQITYLTEENARIYANVVQDSPRVQGSGACPSTTPGTLTLTAASPIDGRNVVLNQEAWKPVGDTYQLCDKTLGCGPLPADHCDSAWVQIAVKGLDVSRHSTGSVEGCDGNWLVMRVPLDPVPCGAGGRPGCSAVINIRRFFLRWVDQKGWSAIVSSAAAGCGTVLSTEPRFPSPLCADLPTPQ